MKEQHKGMLRSLKSGEFDEVIDRFQAGKKVTPKVDEGEKITAPQATAPPVSVAPVQPPPEKHVAEPAAPRPEPVAPKAAPVAAEEKKSSPAVDVSLDEVILSYLMGDD